MVPISGRLLVRGFATAGVVFVLVVADLFVLAAVVFGVRLDYSLEPAWFVLPLLGAPRLVAGLGSGIALALLRSRAGYVFALLGYGAFLLWSFRQYETYVDWSDVRAILRAVVPYASGLIGMSMGIALGWLSSRHRSAPA